MSIKLIIALFFFLPLQLDSKLSVDEFERKLASGDVVLLDVRTQDEVNDGVIASAIHIDYNDSRFNKRLEKLDKTKTYLLYCASDIRSGKAKEIMQEKGFKNVFDLAGGMKAWEAEGKPIVKKQKG